ncbi:TPA: hypothetical protein I8038_000247 [Legionella pneumophila]|nr:hypothetical protein [Legionella pneumophila]
METILNYLINNILSVLGVILGFLGIIASWYFTKKYYEKSLQNQAEETNKEIEKLIPSMENYKDNNGEVIKEQRIVAALNEFIKKGTPVNVIDSFDISDDEKADIYEKACLRKKGRLPKNNPYRKS